MEALSRTMNYFIYDLMACSFHNFFRVWLCSFYFWNSMGWILRSSRTTHLSLTGFSKLLLSQPKKRAAAQSCDKSMPCTICFSLHCSVLAGPNACARLCSLVYNQEVFPRGFTCVTLTFQKKKSCDYLLCETILLHLDLSFCSRWNGSV